MNLFKNPLLLPLIFFLGPTLTLHAEYTEDRISDYEAEKKEIERRHSDFNPENPDSDLDQQKEGFIRLLNVSGNTDEKLSVVLFDQTGDMEILQYAFASGRSTSYRKLPPGDYELGIYRGIEPKLNADQTDLIPVRKDDLIPVINRQTPFELKSMDCLTVLIAPESISGQGLNVNVLEDKELEERPSLRTLNYLQEYKIIGSRRQGETSNIIAPDISFGMTLYPIESADRYLLNFVLEPGDDSQRKRQLSADMDFSLYPAQTVVFHRDRYGRETLTMLRDGLSAALIDQ